MDYFSFWPNALRFKYFCNCFLRRVVVCLAEHVLQAENFSTIFSSTFLFEIHVCVCDDDDREITKWPNNAETKITNMLNAHPTPYTYMHTPHISCLWRWHELKLFSFIWNEKYTSKLTREKKKSWNRFFSFLCTSGHVTVSNLQCPWWVLKFNLVMCVCGRNGMRTAETIEKTYIERVEKTQFIRNGEEYAWCCWENQMKSHMDDDAIHALQIHEFRSFPRKTKF